MPVAFMAVSSLDALMNAENDQHGDQHAQRSDGVDHAGGEIHQVVADGDERSAVADDVAEQFEEGEDQHKHHEADEHHRKCGKELREHVLVEDERKASAGVAWLRGAADGHGFVASADSSLRQA